MSSPDQLDIRVSFGRLPSAQDELQLRENARIMAAHEERRRNMAEDRLGEPAVKIPNIGYVALSKLPEYLPVPVDEAHEAD
jgi:hypothetical protein